MKYANFLPKGGTIGFVAPSFGCNIEPYHSAFLNAQKKWKRQGYHLDLGPNCYEGKGVGISNTPEACGREFTEYYLSEKNDCLISCGGGELMCEILDHVDFDAIAQAAPKWYMGYSDNTNMTYLLATMCDTAAIYGPCAATFGMEPWHKSVKDAMSLLTGKQLTLQGYPKWERESLKGEENPLMPYHVTEKRVLRCYNGREAQAITGAQAAEKMTVGNKNPELSFSGRLLGGCMDCLVNLLGTCYDHTIDFVEKYKEDGIIWFLESCDLNVFGIRRAMWQMEHAGWFQHVKGFLIGRPLCFGQEMIGLDAYQAILEVAARKNVPVIMDVDLGHLPPMMPLIVGGMAGVQVKGNQIAVEMHLK